MTVYFGPVEIRNFGQGASEEVITYPHGSVRLVNGVAEFLHADQLGSVKMVTDSAGLKASQNSYKPFGEVDTTVHNAAVEAETKGFIGERYDSDAGLQYLNARYYDPELGIFVQPDWWEVQAAGTNRFGYGYGDPINLSDPGGNAPDYGYGTPGSYYTGVPDAAKESPAHSWAYTGERIAEQIQLSFEKVAKDWEKLTDTRSLNGNVLDAQISASRRVLDNSNIQRRRTQNGAASNADFVFDIVGLGAVGATRKTSTILAERITASRAEAAAKAVAASMKAYPKTGTVAVGIFGTTKIVGYSEKAARAAGIERSLTTFVRRAFRRSCSGRATCAEAHVIDQAIRMGLDLTGGVIRVVSVGRTGPAAIGKTVPACKVCQSALPKFLQ